MHAKEAQYPVLGIHDVWHLITTQTTATITYHIQLVNKYRSHVLGTVLNIVVHGSMIQVIKAVFKLQTK